MQTSQFTILPEEKIRELYSSREQAKASDREMKGTVENILGVIFQENCRACTHQATSSKNDLGIRGHLLAGSVHPTVTLSDIEESKKSHKLCASDETGR